MARHSGTRLFGADPESRGRSITSGFRVRSRKGASEPGMTSKSTLAKGPCVAETFPVQVEDSYVIVQR
jgi:hypothetical protein